MKNKAIDLNNHLFEQLEWLTDRSIKGEKLTEEIKRAEALVKVAEKIIANNNSVVNAAKVVSESIDKIKLPLLLGE